MNLRETFRYLGYHGQEPDEAAKNLAVICWKELEQAATPRSFYREYPLEFTGDTGIVTPVFETQSANLRKNLKDCEKLLVFAATLGAGVDHLIHFQERDVKDLSHPKKYGFIITNPPYGERLEDKKDLPDLYRAFGESFKRLDSWSAYMITSYDDAERYFGRKADKNRKIYNGMLKTYYYQFLGPRPPKKNRS